MNKNVVWWPAIKNPNHNQKYGGFDYFEFSRKTWEYWCKKNDVLFIPFTEPVEKDFNKINPNWQKCLYVFDELERKNIKYNKIALVDSSCMIKWDAPNFFEMTDDRFTAWRDMDNLQWIHDSIVGYKEFYNNFKCDIFKYFSSGFIIFNKKHKKHFNSLKYHFHQNIEKYLELQRTVKKGNDQTPLNYWLQMNNVEMNLELPLAFKLTHLHRKQMFNYNWQLQEDKTPFFIKYGYNWIFNGIPKDKRTDIMKQTWEFIKENYV